MDKTAPIHKPELHAACGATHEDSHEAAAAHHECGCGCSHEWLHKQSGLTDMGEASSDIDEAPSARAVYRIMAMDCPAEEFLIRKKLGAVPGVADLEFNLMQRVLTVRHVLPSTESIEAALNDIGMSPEAVAAESGPAAAIHVQPTPWTRLAFAGALAALSEAFALISEWRASPFDLDLAAWKISNIAVMEWCSLFLAVAAILLGGLRTYKKGWTAIRNLNLNINALMSVAVTGAVVIGQYPEAAMVMVLFTLAEAIEGKATDRARNAIKSLLDLAPAKAAVLQGDGTWTEMDIRQVAVGSRVRVKPGERIALDGTIVEGQSAVNQAPITGESLPVEKKPGDGVYAGTINESGAFEFQTTAGANDSTLARIIHAVEAAQGSRAPIQRLVDRFAGIYTPLVFLAALLTALIPPLLMRGAWTEWAYTALVLLVIGCPCALIISTPVSIVSGMAGATRHGILIKGGLFLEQGRLLKRLALDKTGTLTHGRPRQSDFAEFGGMDRKQAAAVASSLASRSDHPVSRAIAEKAREDAVPLFEVTDFAAMPGRGICGAIDGKTWFLGNHRLLEERGLCSPELEALLFGMEREGKSVVALFDDAGARGVFAVADTLKAGSLEAIRELKALGVETIMLTGDNEHTAKTIAEQAGVDRYAGNLLPQDKLAAVSQLAGKGLVGMVGDGINDAPALAKADIGFAMAAAGTDAAIETADVALMDDDLRKIPRFIKLSQATYAILMQNIALSLGVKAIFFILAFMGMASMWMAVFADVGVSLLVVANGLRAMRQ